MYGLKVEMEFTLSALGAESRTAIAAAKVERADTRSAAAAPTNEEEERITAGRLRRRRK